LGGRETPMKQLAFVLLLAGAVVGPVQADPLKPGLTDTAKSPHVAIRSVGLTEVRWSSGFWADRFDTCRTSTVPALGRIMEGSDRSQFLHNFRIAAGLEEGKHRGPAWNDGDFYKWLEAAAAVYAVTHDADLDRRMDEAIHVLAKAQRADGYLHTPVLIRSRNGDKTAKPFEDRLNFEMYNFGHLFSAACVHHRATAKKTLLEIAVKAAAFLEEAFKDPTPALARNSVCPSHYMGTIELYRTTRDKKHLELAKKFLALRDLVIDGTDDNQDRIPFDKQTEAVGHAVRANYLYAGVADVYAETGDKTLLPPLTRIWENVVRRKMYVTGACGALYDGASPDGAKDQKQIARTHQAYGRDYQLPNSTAHNETCAAVGNALWNWRMLQITGEPKFADTLELVLYNAVLAGVDLDGTRFFYTNTLRQLDTMPAELRWSRTREPWISSYCCPPNVARMIAEVGGFAYGRSDDSLWIHLYGSNRLDTQLLGGERVRITQTTEYPWNGDVKITVDAAPDREFALQLRIPAWADGAAVTVNGKELATRPVAGKYAAIRRPWAVGDVVQLTLPMRVRLVQAHPLVEELRNQVAVQRGPIVYCLESTDLEKGMALTQVQIPRTIELSARFQPKVLRGVTILEGKGLASGEPTWGDELYRELRPVAGHPVALRLIPYYAWGNRGPSEMTVWLPLTPG
jgi:DUF1680 family protein